MTRAHEIRYAVGSAESWRWFPEVEAYDLLVDQTTPADGVTLRVPWSADVDRYVRPEQEVQVWIDQQRVFAGVIDGRRRTVTRDGDWVTLTARDKVGRFLLDDAAPLFPFAGLGILDLARKLVGDLLTVTASNATNRRLIAGPASKRVSREPPIAIGRDVQRKVEPGDTRWSVLAHWLDLGELLAWATADGKSLVVGRPNYDQPVQWRWTLAGRGERWGSGTVLELEDSQQIGERYSEIVVLGSRASAATEAKAELGRARNGPGPGGTGKDFRWPKRLVLKDDRSDRVRQKLADREMAERDATGREVFVTVAGHGQAAGDGPPAIYTFDSIGELADLSTGRREPLYVTSVAYSGSKADGQRTRLRLVPIGTTLRMA